MSAAASRAGFTDLRNILLFETSSRWLNVAFLRQRIELSKFLNGPHVSKPWDDICKYLISTLTMCVKFIYDADNNTPAPIQYHSHHTT